MVVCHVTPASRLALDVVCSGVGHQFLAALADDFGRRWRSGQCDRGNRRESRTTAPVRCRTVDRPVVLGTDRSGRNGGSRSVPAAGSGRVGGGLSVGRSPDVVVPPRQCPPPGCCGLWFLPGSRLCACCAGVFDMGTGDVGAETLIRGSIFGRSGLSPVGWLRLLEGNRRCRERARPWGRH